MRRQAQAAVDPRIKSVHHTGIPATGRKETHSVLRCSCLSHQHGGVRAGSSEEDVEDGALDGGRARALENIGREPERIRVVDDKGFLWKQTLSTDADTESDSKGEPESARSRER